MEKTPVSKEEVIDFLKSNDGFHLEMGVVRLLQQNGIPCEHGGTYSDPSSGKDRQFDVQATRQDDDNFLRMAIECKCISENSPIVVSRLKQSDFEEGYMVMSSTKAGTEEVFKTKRVACRLFSKSEWVGKSINQLNVIQESNARRIKPSDDQIFTKWTQSVSSATRLCSKMITDYQLLPMWATVAVSATIPILIIPDRTLWIANYNDKGELLEVSRDIDIANLYIGRKVQILDTEYDLSHLLIITITGFERFLRTLTFKGDNSVFFSEANGLRAALCI